MKFFIVAALIAVASADVSHLTNINNQYLPPSAPLAHFAPAPGPFAPAPFAPFAPNNEYLPPTAQYPAPIPAYHQFQRFQPAYAHAHAHSFAPAPIYAPGHIAAPIPAPIPAPFPAPVPAPFPAIAETAPAAVLHDDGYSYRNPNLL